MRFWKDVIENKFIKISIIDFSYFVVKFGLISLRILNMIFNGFQFFKRAPKTF